jgi:hypothetical protein
VTATTLSAQPSRLTGRGRSAGDAQERAATNPVAALPCARTPLPHPLSTPLLNPLLIPPSAPVGVNSPTRAPFGQVRATDPGQSRAKTARDWPGSRWSQTQWRATQSPWVAGAFLSGRPPTNGVGGLPPGSRGHRWSLHHGWWSHG